MKTVRGLTLALLVCFMVGCEAQVAPATAAETKPAADSIVDTVPYPPAVLAFMARHPDNGQPSVSNGRVSEGSLVNGKLLPWRGKNYQYFSEESFVGGRAFVNGKVREVLVGAYAQLDAEVPGRQFRIMESSNEKGGQMWPHRTHQNGLSVDLMVPVMWHRAPCYDLDALESSHYALEFDDHGRLSTDTTISIDFDLVARHIHLLDVEARKHGLMVSKVIFRLELMDELKASGNGKKLTGIYFARNLTPLINSLHDDHYHVDFAPLK